MLGLEHSPFNTAWGGTWTPDEGGQSSTLRLESLVISAGRRVTGSGSDALGAYTLDGKLESIKERKRVLFQKNYADAALGFVRFDGVLSGPGKHQVLMGHWTNSDGAQGSFTLDRDPGLEQQREAAFRMVVARMKMLAALVRLLFEDVVSAGIQVMYLLHSIHHSDSGHSWVSLRFTLISIAASLTLSVAGPLAELVAGCRYAADAGEAAESPPTVDGQALDLEAEQGYAPLGPGRGSVAPGRGSTMVPGRGSMALLQAEEKAKLADWEKTERAEREEKMAAAQTIEGTELLLGNLDYVDLLMESPDEPARVPDVAVTDVIHSRPGVHRALLGAAGLFWTFSLSWPFVFHVTCADGVPATAHLCFVLFSVLHFFTQIWVAISTKYGYLMFTHAPQQLAFAFFLTFLGHFDTYSDMAFILMARDCGSWLWQPALAVYLLGVVGAQASVGFVLLGRRRNLPAAMKLLDMNVLLLLLKPSISE